MLKHEFSWSLTRHKIFEQCRRKYYNYYYGSWNGWDKYADEKTRLLYSLKKLQSIPSWTESIFIHVLREACQNKKLTLHELTRSATKQIRKRFLDLTDKTTSPEFRQPFLTEMIYGNFKIEELHFKVESKLKKILANFAESPFYEIMADLNPFSIKNIPQPASFYLNGVKIWANPDFIWTEKGTIKVSNLSINDPMQSAEWAFKATMDSMLVKELFPGSQHIETSSFFLHQPRFPEITISRNKQEVQTIIDNSCKAMLDLTDLDTNIKEEIFQKADGEICKNCNFRKACQI